MLIFLTAQKSDVLSWDQASIIPKKNMLHHEMVLFKVINITRFNSYAGHILLRIVIDYN